MRALLLILMLFCVVASDIADTYCLCPAAANYIIDDDDDDDDDEEHHHHSHGQHYYFNADQKHFSKHNILYHWDHGHYWMPASVTVQIIRHLTTGHIFYEPSSCNLHELVELPFRPPKILLAA